MSVLLLRLAGPLQSWGSSSRFSRRDTDRYPTKSGVLGLLAAAQGRRRTDPIEDLANLRFGVRVEQPGEMLRDFHTAHRWKAKGDPDSMPLSSRYYLSDAVFVAGVEGDHGLLEVLDAAIQRPQFPLFLGRRSCPVEGKVSLGLRATGLAQALREEPWHAAGWYQRRARRESNGSNEQHAFLDLMVDAGDDVEVDYSYPHRDVPQSYSSQRRLYGWRDVAALPRVLVPLREPADFDADGPDFLDALEVV